MSTNVQVHHPEPPNPGMTVDGTDGTFTRFHLDDVSVFIHDPAWFDAVGVWAKQEALRLRAAKAGVQPCENCGQGGQVVVDPASGRRLCARCYGQVAS